ncbi:hypothetical protein WR25_08814 isoform B [Diploscapter pachys]|uniref:CCR4-NOT transcription complex subunit 1 TTP binding domain-containing protein n=1 Tax=Diploscapter pachys TaxID=2018661 RepID=A0A2A2J8A3_9BILA|nr:hypothetical protein WR25_08814 isoform A [Diploscapter pachys]PAV57829.1 hypothetical protein WR25_08814 isoform B [Diploscapter pachys]
MMLKDNSGRNSAVAGGSRGSGVGPPVFGSNQPGPPPGGLPQRTNSFSASGMPHYNPMAGRLDMGGHQPPGMSLMMGMGMPFNGARDILKNVQPSANPPASQMSPSSQMMRSAIQQPQRQNSSSTPWHLLANAAPPVGRTPGPPTPGLDFKPQMPPTAAQPDFAPARSTVFTMPSSLSSGGIQYSGSDDIQFPEDVQDEANSYFEKIYSQAGTLTVEDLIRQLKAFKNSNNSRDQKVLNCVVKNLFEEYRFFHEYPDRELKTTAEMYGGIIREGIIR